MAEDDHGEVSKCDSDGGMPVFRPPQEDTELEGVICEAKDPVGSSHVHDVEKNRAPWGVYVILLLALLAVSSAASAFKALRVEIMLKATWRLQATSLLLLPPCIWQCYQLRRENIGLWNKLFAVQSILILL
jgi:hypothetical protein